MMAATILPHGTSIIANTPPNDHDPTHTRIPPPVPNVHTDWCHRLVTPVFEGARDDGASLFHPQCCCCRRHFAQGPLCDLVKYFPTNTERPHGLVPSSQHHCFLRVPETMAPTVSTHDAAIIADAPPNGPDPIFTKIPLP